MSKLREWRRSKRLTQGKLAQRLETTAATVSRIETGEQWPSPALLSSIERVTRGAVLTGQVLADYQSAQRARLKIHASAAE